MKFGVVNRCGDSKLPLQVTLNFERVFNRRRVNDSGTVERVTAGEERREDLQLIGFFIGLSRLVN